ncbi:IPTL-CTERM sorting domain-containing protein [Comamonas sp. NLF-1-9]|uniref:IPTL-CTERM sorting domain-containing protein n=1 Tax=Comamonas sp. NLF-1-9 TaxID=2853163 RepID=UPI001C47A6DC|nr:IPTL-CTERM sorting domain-containing protein [Comamonas sp. NLF-1-9]QXL83590.1 IPTL-CTERM sorting domain-containing protein [Comamonas sp. NLF-1-9]
MTISAIEPLTKSKPRRGWAPLGKANAMRAAWGMALALLVAPLAQASWVNGGFEASSTTDLNSGVVTNGWLHKTYSRTAVLPASPPVPNMTTGIALNQLGLTSENLNNAGNRSAIITAPATDMPLSSGKLSSVKAPRWDDKALKLNSVGGQFASSIEQTATMTVDDVDPRDDRVHIRFAMAPIMVDGGHGPTEQPYFFVQVRNITKNKVMFYTYNYSTQPGVPWQIQSVGSYRWTDWQGVDVAPGNGQLDVGDQVQLIVYAANCEPGAAAHEARVYLDAVGVFMPGLSVEAKGPSVTTPGAAIQYTYNYVNNSPDMTLGSKVYVAAPKTENGLELDFDTSSIPSYCSATPVYPSPNPASRGKYIVCDVGGAGGQLNPGEGGSFPISFTVPGAAVAGDVINNGDYNISSNTVSAYIGPMVKTNIVAAATPLVDLAVTVDNGGKVAYGTNEAVTYTVKVTNNGPIDQTGTVTQTLKGLGEACGALTFNPALGAGFTCAGGGAPGSGVTITFPTGSLTTGGVASYTVSGTTAGTAGTPVNTAVSVAPTGGATDSNPSNNTDGMQTPVAASTPKLTVEATGSGSGYVQATPAALACGNATPVTGKCSSTEQDVGEGQEVLLYATAHPGSIFSGWTNCPGTVTDNVCKLTKGAGAETATARFDIAHVVTPTVTGGTSGPAGPSLVPDGGSRSFTLTPTVPNSVPKIDTGSTTCTGSLAGPDGSGNYVYTVNPVNDDCAFTVNFVSPDVYPTNDVTNTRPETPVIVSVLDNDRGDRPLGTVTTTGAAPTKGGVSCTTAGICTYTPAAGQTGTDTFSYEVCLIAPNHAVCKTATVTVNISSAGVVATNDVTNTPQGQSKTIPVLQNDTTSGGGAIDPTSVAITSNPSNGGVVCSPTTGECAYTPNGPFTGTDQFTYKVCLAAPNQTVCDEAQVTVAVTPAGGGGVTPTVTANNDPVSTGPGAPVNVPVTVNDTATGGVINLSSVVTTSGPANGTVNCTATPGICRYTPNPGFIGEDTFTYKVCLAAPSAAVCDEAVVRVRVMASPAAIPTLSEWGLIILSALMGLLMVGMHRRRMF